MINSLRSELFLSYLIDNGWKKSERLADLALNEKLGTPIFLSSLTKDFVMIPDILSTASKFIPSNIAEIIADAMCEEERASIIPPVAAEVIRELLNVPGITPASSRDLKRSQNIFQLSDGTVTSVFINPVGCQHVFLSNKKRECIFGGFTGWVHNNGLKNKIQELKEKYVA
jgi:hypothetical protein